MMIYMSVKISPLQRFKTLIQSVSRWLIPGLEVKRWFGLVIFGTTVISLGVADILLDFYRESTSVFWTDFVYYLSLLFLPPVYRALIFGTVGFGSILYGVMKLNQAILKPFIRPGKPIIDVVENFRRQRRGPHVAVIGGGQGLSTLLSGMKNFTRNLTAIVTVADDGGSSGRLRDTLGILPPGDIRNCLAALSSDEDLITQLFQYRFVNGGGDLEGHSFGNLFISALTDLTGSFEKAVAESGKVLSAHGNVLPSTLHDVRLLADKSLPFVDGEITIDGESRIPKIEGQVQRVWLEPKNPPAYPDAIQKILNADLIVIGPGSLYTSIIPNLLVPDIAMALQSSKALKVFVCNLVAQPGETEGYTCLDHVQAVEQHSSARLFDLVIVNDFDGKQKADLEWVGLGKDLDKNYPVYRCDVADPEKPGYHHAGKLSKALIDLLMERTGPLVF